METMACHGDAVIDIEIERAGTETSNPREEITQIEPIQSKKTKDEDQTPKQAIGQDSLQNLIQRLNDVDHEQPITIFRVPAYLREKSKELHEPRMVSIGPYYHGREELRTMEEHKLKCLRDFLNRNTERSIEDYFQEMKKLEKRARQCYSESIKMDSDKFVLMLLLDGCFILEYSLRKNEGVFDALIDRHNTTIRADFIVFNNQIPFFVIHKLVSLSYQINCNEHCPVPCVLFACLPYMGGYAKYSKVSCDNVDHLLHLCYNCVVPKFDITQINSPCTQPHSIKTECLSWLLSKLPWKSREDFSTRIFPCATTLNESGVTFRRKKNPGNMFDITFHNGVMEIPAINVDEYMVKIVFTNLIAFEQSHNPGMTFTSFAALLDFLINTGNDVAILEQHGIIINSLDGDNLAAFFNQLCDGTHMNYQQHHFATLFREIEKYSNSTWPKYRAKLKHDYFSNPWASISVFAGMLLLGLTVTQTYYTIFSAYHL